MKAKFCKWGPMFDYRGAHVTLEWKGRTLLGEIVSIERCPVRGAMICVVRHMNGEEWPIQPGLGVA